MGLLLAVLLIAQSTGTCADARDCRQQALAAAASGDYETFHDLAWRAVQKGRANDPDLMYVLARAQSLSGRPGDALVMLQRLADMGVALDVATSDDFRRVRALKGWADLEPRIAKRAPLASNATPSPEDNMPAPSPTADATEEALSFAAAPFEPAGLAYDAVSRRFIVGDRNAARLFVIDEVSHHVANLVSAASAGFYDTITAFEIDAKRGDLWVASASDSTSMLHKLQLVSGRTLLEIPASSDDGPVRFVDVAVAADGTLLALDATGSRIFRVRPQTRALEIVVTLTMKHPTGMALGPDHAAYISGDEGLMRLDLASNTLTTVRSAVGVELKEISHPRWYAGSLIVLQRSERSGSIVRLQLDSAGVKVVKRETLAPPFDAGIAATIAGKDVFYLLAGQGASSSIRRTRLR